MSAALPTGTAAESRPRRGRPSLLRLLYLLTFAAAIAGIGVWGVAWWEDRPLGVAEAALQQKDPQACLKALGPYLAAYPGEGRGLALRGRALVQLGRYPEAQKIFGEIGAAAPADLHAWAQTYLHQEAWTRARGLLERLLELEPNHIDGLHEVTACRTFLGDYAAALESAQKLAQLPGQETRAQLQIGTIHHNRGNYQAAIVAWKRVLELDPEAKTLQIPGDDFLRSYGALLLDAGQPPEAAAAALRQSISLRDSADARFRLGQALMQQGNSPEALVEWEQALKLQPNHRLACESLADLALQRRDSAAALRILLPLADDPRIKASTGYLLQRSYALAGDQLQSKKWSERTVEMRHHEGLQAAVEHVLLDAPESFWGKVIRCRQFASEGNWSEAEMLFDEVLAQSPKEPYLRQLGQAIATKGPLPGLADLPIKRY